MEDERRVLEHDIRIVRMNMIQTFHLMRLDPRDPAPHLNHYARMSKELAILQLRLYELWRRVVEFQQEIDMRCAMEGDEIEHVIVVPFEAMDDILPPTPAIPLPTPLPYCEVVIDRLPEEIQNQLPSSFDKQMEETQ